MKQEDKELLLKDLCARLPYGIIAHNSFGNFDVEITGIFGVESADISCTYISVKEYIDSEDNIECIKPYLRSMLSMTQDERTEMQDYTTSVYRDYHQEESDTVIYQYKLGKCLNWLNSHHFDYRGLIEKGLALEAPEGMYNIKD